MLQLFVWVLTISLTLDDTHGLAVPNASIFYAQCLRPRVGCIQQEDTKCHCFPLSLAGLSWTLTADFFSMGLNKA